jgi:hypothetical protein
MRVPTRSDGIRSGVNWMRLNEPPRTSGEGLDRQRLGQARHALEEEVTTGQQADEDPLEHRVLADDDSSDLEHDRLRGGARVRGIGEGAQVGAGRGGRVGHVGHVGLRKSGAGTSTGVGCVSSTFAEFSEGFLRSRPSRLTFRNLRT